jgi:hypothetical protein
MASFRSPTIEVRLKSLLTSFEILVFHQFKNEILLLTNVHKRLSKYKENKSFLKEKCQNYKFVNVNPNRGGS